MNLNNYKVLLKKNDLKINLYFVFLYLYKYS